MTERCAASICTLWGVWRSSTPPCAAISITICARSYRPRRRTRAPSPSSPGAAASAPSVSATRWRRPSGRQPIASSSARRTGRRSFRAGPWWTTPKTKPGTACSCRWCRGCRCRSSTTCIRRATSVGPSWRSRKPPASCPLTLKKEWISKRSRWGRRRGPNTPASRWPRQGRLPGSGRGAEAR